MNKAIDIAKLLIECLKVDGEPTVTNTALQKLLYFAQAHCLARLGRPLFADRIEAWQKGPVVPDVYQVFKDFRGNAIILTEKAKDELEIDERVLLAEVINEYGKFSAKRLVAMTHKDGSPWQVNFDPKAETHDKEISHEEMKAYFSEKEILPKFVLPAHIQTVDRFPADWYDPEEDAIWEEYVK